MLERLKACRSREPRLPLVSAEEVQKLTGGDEPASLVDRLLGHFPVHGKQWVLQLRAARDKGRLSPELKAQIAYTAARQDRAWYALADARARLLALGYNDDRVFALDDLTKLPEAEQAALGLARKSTASPQRISDADIAAARQHFSDNEVAEIMYHVTVAAFVDRLSEAAGLPVE